MAPQMVYYICYFGVSETRIKLLTSMKFTLRNKLKLNSKIYSAQIKDGKFIVIRHKFPQMKILYDSEKRMGSVIEKEANVPEAKIQQAFFEALAWAKKK
ncbi:MAG TPA: hypothetical protein VGI61_04350 [Parafilimonas sp.]